MDSQLVQRTRYQLQTRVRTVKTCPLLLFPVACGHLLDWIDNHPLLSALVAPLRGPITAHTTRLEADLAKLGTPAYKEITGPWETKSREDAAALAVAALRSMRDVNLDDHGNNQKAYIVAFVSAAYQPPRGKNPKGEEIVEALRDVCVQAIYDYLDEAIDSRNAVLALLVKYKHRCEMYRRYRLRDAATSGLEGRDGEKALAFDLYEYLHDQGVDFWIESTSASGEPDLVSREAGGEPLVADAKYIRSDLPRNKVVKTVASGFRQVLDYCKDHDEPVGYLVIFVDKDITIDLEAERDDAFLCFRTGGYTVYYVIIDIFGHNTTASKRPNAPVIKITRDEVIANWDEANDAGDEASGDKT